MSKSIDCSSGLHDWCAPCDCNCHVKHLHCLECGGVVSNAIIPANDKEIQVRAWVVCPECLTNIVAGDVK